MTTFNTDSPEGAGGSWGKTRVTCAKQLGKPFQFPQATPRPFHAGPYSNDPSLNTSSPAPGATGGGGGDHGCIGGRLGGCGGATFAAAVAAAAAAAAAAADVALGRSHASYANGCRCVVVDDDEDDGHGAGGTFTASAAIVQNSPLAVSPAAPPWGSGTKV